MRFTNNELEILRKITDPYEYVQKVREIEEVSRQKEEEKKQILLDVLGCFIVKHILRDTLLKKQVDTMGKGVVQILLKIGGHLYEL